MPATVARIGVGPLSAVAAELAGATASPGATDPAAFLARLMDLRGSVELAQRLAAGDRVRGAPEPTSRVMLRGLVAERLDALEDDVLRTLAEPFRPRNRLPTPEQVVTTLIDTGALLGRRARTRAVSAASDVLWAPCADLLGRMLGRVRFGVAALREEIGPSVSALGPAAARLERLDAALFAAAGRGRAELEDHLMSALARSFAERFAATIAALPGATAPAHVRPWFEEGGILRVEIAHGRDVILGILAHDRRRLTALIAAGVLEP